MSQPFARARAMMDAISAMLAISSASYSPETILAAVGTYRSRGHGRDSRSQSSTQCVAMDKRAALKKRNQLAHRRHCR